MGGAAAGIGSGRVIGGRYRLLSMLGRGGMAQVWRGFDQRLDREVAVKILDVRDAPGACERFEREARTAAALTHPNIVGLHDAGSDDGVDYLVMELVEGETLSERIRRGPLPPADITELAGQICDALAAAHGAGIVHRDIKPGNILITAAGRVKVCDFGIACQDNDAFDATGEVAVGTAQYMAPEQARGGPATPRTDLYGLGCVIYAMTTGHPPFPGTTAAHVAWQHLHEPSVPLASRRPGTPSWLESLVASLLAKDPASRPASADEVRALLPPARRLSRKPAAGTGAGSSPTTALPCEPTVALSPTAPLPAGRARLATMSVLTFVALAAVILVLTFVSANDMPVPFLGRADAPVQTPQPSQSSPSTPPPATAAAPMHARVRPVSDPSTALHALRAAYDQQVRAGNITGKPLRDLDDKLGEIERDLARGEDSEAADRLAAFAKRLIDLHRDGKITAVTLTALQPALIDLAGQLPDPSGN